MFLSLQISSGPKHIDCIPKHIKSGSQIFESGSATLKSHSDIKYCLNQQNVVSSFNVFWHTIKYSWFLKEISTWWFDPVDKKNGGLWKMTRRCGIPGLTMPAGSPHSSGGRVQTALDSLLLQTRIVTGIEYHLVNRHARRITADFGLYCS